MAREKENRDGDLVGGMATVVCCFAALWECDQGKHRTGDLLLVQLSDTDHLLKFVPTDPSSAPVSTDTSSVHESYDNSCAQTIDIDDAEFFDAKCNIIFNKDPFNVQKNLSKKDYTKVLGTVHMTDNAHYRLFKEAVLECREVCELALRWEAVVRDVYYAGIYSSLSKDHNILLANEITKLHNNDSNFKICKIPAHEGLHTYIDDTPIDDRGMGIITKDEIRKARFALVEDVDNEYIDKGVPITCVFCDMTSEKNISLQYYFHPYALNNFDSSPIFMCSICITNWKKYRDVAEKENRLILPEEVNEEICCICSDTPIQLVLCSSCPRSFCRHCLTKILTTKQLEDIDDETKDWTCMPCNEKLTTTPDLRKEHWRKVKLVSGLWVDIKSGGIKRDFRSDGANRKRGGPPKKSKDPKSKLGPLDGTQLAVSARPAKGVLPPVNTDLDETYYFAQYVKVSDSIDPYFKLLDNNTEEVCYLCKDGGELVECDYKYSKEVHVCGKKQRCKKVYHPYCLAYNIPADEEWCCPRHFCDLCGCRELKYVCAFCPISICANCPEAFVNQFGLKKYVHLSTKESPNKDEISIICQHCIEMCGKSMKRNELPADYDVKKKGKARVFPGGSSSTTARALSIPQGQDAVMVVEGGTRNSKSPQSAKKNDSPTIKYDQKQIKAMKAAAKAAVKDEGVDDDDGAIDGKLNTKSPKGKPSGVSPPVSGKKRVRQSQQQGRDSQSTDSDDGIDARHKASPIDKTKATTKQTGAKRGRPPGEATLAKRRALEEANLAKQKTLEQLRAEESANKQDSSSTSNSPQIKASSSDYRNRWTESELFALTQAHIKYANDVVSIMKDKTFSKALKLKSMAEIRVQLSSLYANDPRYKRRNVKQSVNSPKAQTVTFHDSSHLDVDVSNVCDDDDEYESDAYENPLNHNHFSHAKVNNNKNNDNIAPNGVNRMHEAAPYPDDVNSYSAII